MIYWQVAADMSFPNRWLLKGVADSYGSPIRDKIFSQAIPATGAAPSEVLVLQEGVSLDFDQTTLGTYVVRTEIGNILSDIEPEAIERFPVRVAGLDEQFDVLNVISEKDCIDKKRSKVRYWTEDDCLGLPALVGRYKAIEPVTVDPALTDGAHIFRVKGFSPVLIVSDTVRRALEGAEVTGIEFWAV